MLVHQKFALSAVRELTSLDLEYLFLPCVCCAIRERIRRDQESLHRFSAIFAMKELIRLVLESQEN